MESLKYMDDTINSTIIEKLIIKSVAIYKAMDMLSQPPFEDKFKKEKLCQQNENTQKQNSEKCLNEPEKRIEQPQNVDTNETKIVNEQENLNTTTQIKSGIYKIINKVNGKFYVGSSVDLERRKRTHFNHLAKNIHKNYNLQKDYNEYGNPNFEFIVLRKALMPCLLILEQSFLSTHKNNPLCYNIKFNVFDMPYTGGKPLSIKHKEKLSISHLGKKLSDDHRKKIGESHLGKKRTVQTRSRISIANKGRKLTKEWKDKISQSNKGKRLGLKNPWYGKGYLQIGKSNPSFDHTLYKWFNKNTSNIEICHRNTLIKKYKLSESHIYRVINGKRKSHKGWTLVGVIE